MLDLIPTEAISTYLLPILFGYFSRSSTKWQSKVAALNVFVYLSETHPKVISSRLVDIIPHLTDAIHDTKSQVCEAAKKAASAACATVDNQDINKFIPVLVECMANPNEVAAGIKKLSSTTFVAEVTGPALAIIVPLLVRALKERSQETLRWTCIVVDNLCRLIRDPTEAEADKYIPNLRPGVENVLASAAMPEVRHLAHAAKTTIDSILSQTQQSTEKEVVNIAEIERAIESALGGATQLKEDFAHTLVAYLASILAVVIEEEDYAESRWTRFITCYLAPMIGLEAAAKESKILRETYLARHLGNRARPEAEDGEEVLVDTDFSLAYGGMMLLNHTNLTLFRGRRYGICAHNGAGKSTLMRSIAEGKLEGFPGRDEVRTCFVEHKLQGAEGDMEVLKFLQSDPELSHVAAEKVAEALRAVGFSDVYQKRPVSSLSGGWKMKLELARAQIMDADILLLDEPTNHLDITNVAWLEKYLNTNTRITSLIVSHDSGFLDNVCTDIIHYERKKLMYYRGNLSDFVKKKPEAKTYYTLSSSNVAFKFPPPGILAGIRSRTKAIIRMQNVSYTYPNSTGPSLADVSCALSLSSRVAILGPNGAGKSTLVKLMTGEVMPQEGRVDKHPNLRVGYVAQHAFHHVEQHLTLTPIQYIIWRYTGGEDREVLAKQTRLLSDEEKKQLEKPVVLSDGSSRNIEYLIGRQKLKKTFQYEIKWLNMPHKHNSWVAREKLIDHGFAKLVQQFDDYEASREGLGARDLMPSVIRKHYEELGLNGDIAEYHEISGLSGGQKVKVVIAAAMWNNPHLLVLDEPSNYLDRDALGGLAVAIRDWEGSVVMISHNAEFVSALCSEQWHIAAGQMVQKGKSAVAMDRFDESAPASGNSSDASTTMIGRAKKARKKTRNEAKVLISLVTNYSANTQQAQEIRRKERHANWLLSPPGTPRPSDSDSD